MSCLHAGELSKLHAAEMRTCGDIKDLRDRRINVRIPLQPAASDAGAADQQAIPAIRLVFTHVCIPCFALPVVGADMWSVWVSSTSLSQL